MVTRRTLIATADDLGISTAVNDGIVLAYRHGILRFASLMVCEPAAREAVERVRAECPGLGVGLHLVLCRGKAASAPSALDGLVDGAGRFGDDPVACGLRYFFDGSLRAALEREARAQFERFLAFGLPPDHVDGHLNIHVHPVVFPMAARLAKEYGFGRLRLPGGELSSSLSFSRRRLGGQLAEAAAFGLLRAYLKRARTEPGLEVCDRTFGLLRSGLMSERYLLALLARLGEGTSEVYFHPSSDPASEADERPTPGHHSISELRALTSPRVRDALERYGIELAGAGDLSSAA